MLIRTRNYIGDKEIVLVNINIDSSELIKIEDKSIIFSPNKRLTFSSEEQAMVALDKIFKTYGYKAPFNKYLDLTIEETEVDSDNHYYLTMQEIANKLKIDPRKLRIVDDSSFNNLEDEDSEE